MGTNLGCRILASQCQRLVPLRPLQNGKRVSPPQPIPDAMKDKAQLVGALRGLRGFRAVSLCVCVCVCVFCLCVCECANVRMCERVNV